MQTYIVFDNYKYKALFGTDDLNEAKEHAKWYCESRKKINQPFDIYILTNDNIPF